MAVIVAASRLGMHQIIVLVNDSSTIAFITNRFSSCQRCNKMAHPLIGLLFIGLIIRTVIAAVVVVALVWLVLKLGRLADVYTEKLRKN